MNERVDVVNAARETVQQLLDKWAQPSTRMPDMDDVDKLQDLLKLLSEPEHDIPPFLYADDLWRRVREAIARPWLHADEPDRSLYKTEQAIGTFQEILADWQAKAVAAFLRELYDQNVQSGRFR